MTIRHSQGIREISANNNAVSDHEVHVEDLNNLFDCLRNREQNFIYILNFIARSECSLAAISGRTQLREKLFDIEHLRADVENNILKKYLDVKISSGRPKRIVEKFVDKILQVNVNVTKQIASLSLGEKNEQIATALAKAEEALIAILNQDQIELDFLISFVIKSSRARLESELNEFTNQGPCSLNHKSSTTLITPATKLEAKGNAGIFRSPSRGKCNANPIRNEISKSGKVLHSISRSSNASPDKFLLRRDISNESDNKRAAMLNPTKMKLQDSQNLDSSKFYKAHDVFKNGTRILPRILISETPKAILVDTVYKELLIFNNEIIKSRESYHIKHRKANLNHQTKSDPASCLIEKNEVLSPNCVIRNSYTSTPEFKEVRPVTQNFNDTLCYEAMNPLNQYSNKDLIASAECETLRQLASSPKFDSLTQNACVSSNLRDALDPPIRVQSAQNHIKAGSQAPQFDQYMPLWLPFGPKREGTGLFAKIQANSQVGKPNPSAKKVLPRTRNSLRSASVSKTTNENRISHQIISTVIPNEPKKQSRGNNTLKPTVTNSAKKLNLSSEKKRAVTAKNQQPTKNFPKAFL